MPVAFPSRDYDAEEVLCLLHKFEATLVEKSFTSIQTYANAIDDFVKKNVVADLEPFFRTIAQNIQMFCSDADGSIIGIHEGLRAVTDQMEKVSGKIQDNFLPFLQEGSFLVHGDSELLANVLEDCLQQNPNVDILILEGLPSYSGINLLNRLKESPVVQNNPEYLKRLLLAPDSSALRLLQRRKCNFVLFGAHAVTPHGCLVNSAGSLQLATLAKESNVAVYSLCPTFKFYLSMPRMPFSSDDLEVLGAKLLNSPNNAGGGGAYGGRANSTHSSHSHTSSPTHTSKNTTNNATSSSRPHDDELLLTGSQQQNLNANSNPNNNNNMGQPLGSNSDRLSRNSPSLQIQQQHQSITNASFSAPPPSIQISPQLHPALAGGNSGLNANNNNTNNNVSNMPRPQQPPFSLSTPPDASASSNNNIVRPSTSTPPDDASASAPNSGTNLATTAAAAVNNAMRSNASSVQGSVQLGPSVVSAANNNNSNKNNNCGTNSAPQVSPVLTATSPFHGPFLGNSMNHETSNNQNQNQRSTSNGTPSQQFQYHAHHALPTASTLSKNDHHHQQHGHPPDLHNHNYFAPTCAFQLDLIGADKITHFFTEHGVVMPWSVADKISKIFLKEIQNKRKVNRGMGAGGVGGGVGGFGGF